MKFLRNLLASIFGTLIALGIIFMLFVLIASVLTESEKITVKKNSVLEIRLNAEIKDYAPKSDDPFEELLGLSSKKMGLNDIVNAIENAKNLGIDLKKSTLFVTLEPCSHYGKTPPCAMAIVEAKIPNVFFGFSDPDPRVNGNGVKFLRENGVNVEFLPTDSIVKLH